MVNIRHTIRRYDKRPKTFPKKVEKKPLDMAEQLEIIQEIAERLQPKRYREGWEL